MTDTLKRIFRRSPSGSREDSSRPRKRASNKNVSPMNAPVSPEGYPSPGWAENPANTPSSEVLRPHDGPPESPNEMPRPTPVPPLPGTSPTARGTPIPPPRPTNTPQDSGINQQKKADKNISGGDGQDALAGVVRDMYRSSLDYTGQPQEGTSRQDKTPDKRDEPSKAKKDFSHSEGPSHFNEKVNHLSSLTAVATLRQQIRGTSTARVALEQNLHAQTQSLTEHLDQLLHLEKKHKLELDRAVDALREVYEVRVHKLDDEVRELRQEVALERRRESELDKAVREAKGALEELRREIRRLQDELSQRDSKISMSTLHIQQLTETRDKLAEDLQCQRSRTSSRNAQDYELEQRTPEEWKAELDRITKERDSALVKLARLEEDLPKENKQEEVPGETQPLAIAVPGQAEEQNNLGPVEERESKVQEILPSDVTTEKQDKPGSEENRESKVQEISPSDVTTEEQDKLGSAEKRESKVQEVPPSDVGPVDNHPDRPVGESQNPWDEAFSHQLEDMRDNVKELVARIQKEEIPAKEMRRAAELVCKEMYLSLQQLGVIPAPVAQDNAFVGMPSDREATTAGIFAAKMEYPAVTRSLPPPPRSKTPQQPTAPTTQVPDSQPHTPPPSPPHFRPISRSPRTRLPSSQTFGPPTGGRDRSTGRSNRSHSGSPRRDFEREKRAHTSTPLKRTEGPEPWFDGRLDALGVKVTDRKKSW